MRLPAREDRQCAGGAPASLRPYRGTRRGRPSGGISGRRSDRRAGARRRRCGDRPRARSRSRPTPVAVIARDGRRWRSCADARARRPAVGRGDPGLGVARPRRLCHGPIGRRDRRAPCASALGGDNMWRRVDASSGVQEELMAHGYCTVDADRRRHGAGGSVRADAQSSGASIVEEALKGVRAGPGPRLRAGQAAMVDEAVSGTAGGSVRPGHGQSGGAGTLRPLADAEAAGRPAGRLRRQGACWAGRSTTAPAHASGRSSDLGARRGSGGRPGDGGVRSAVRSARQDDRGRRSIADHGDRAVAMATSWS